MGEAYATSETASAKTVAEGSEHLREHLRDPEMVLVDVDGQAIAEVISSWTGIPVGKMVSDEIQTILHLGEKMAERVVGQDHALNTIAKRIHTSRASLDNPSRPVGVFLLIFVLRLATGWATRRVWPAVAIAFAIMTVLQALGQTTPATALDWVLAAAIWGILIGVILRLGLLAASFAFVYANMLLFLPYIMLAVVLTEIVHELARWLPGIIRFTPLLALAGFLALVFTFPYKARNGVFISGAFFFFILE